VSRPEAWDAVARLSATVEGIKGAYATTAGTQGAAVRSWPGHPPDFPIARVLYSDSDVEQGALRRSIHRFTVRVYLGVDEAAAYKTGAPMLDRFLTASDADIDLYTTAVMALVTGSDGFDTEDFDNGTTWFHEDIRVEVTELTTTSPTV
jgi:hypothetical protein